MQPACTVPSPRSIIHSNTKLPQMPQIFYKSCYASKVNLNIFRLYLITNAEYNNQVGNKLTMLYFILPL
jgi:hypothetical protein